MAELPLSQDAVETLSLPSLILEVSAEPSLVRWAGELIAPIRTLWPHFLEQAVAVGLFEPLDIDPERHTMEVELTFADNGMIQALNRDYRQKDAATDVLTFPLATEASDFRAWRHLPALPLGNIVISIDWARNAVAENPGADLHRYLMERFIHGLLHLLGQHHDTMAQYRRVVDFQNRVLDNAFGKP